MQPKDLRDLFFLAFIWGFSFPLIRLSAPEFGPFALVEVRVAISAVFLLTILIVTGRLHALRASWKPIFLCGLVSIAAPFLLFAYASLSLSAGILSVINALTPLFGALIARLWLKEHLTRMRMAGLLIGVMGIAVLVSDRISGSDGVGLLPIFAAIGGPLCYGLAACCMTRWLHNVDPLANASGGLLSSAIVLLPLSIFYWPEQNVSGTGWISVIMLALLCTGVAYILFYHLITRIGSIRTITVTFLTPPFGIALGILLLDETLGWHMAIGTLVVLLGTLLATGVIAAKPSRNTASAKKKNI